MAYGPRTLLSLFDHSGEWSRPFAEAGWNVLQVDLKHGDDIRQFSAEWLLENVLQGYDAVDGILAAPPCTDFTVTAARHWKNQDASGSTACSVELVRQALRTVDFLKPAFWAIENPAGRIAALVPGVGARRMVWDPCDFAGWTFPTRKDLRRLELLRKKNLDAGDAFTKDEVDFVKRINAYTKRTVLYGDFNAPEKRRLEPINTSKWGSWLQSLGGKSAKTKELRSITPAGFARAFYEATKERAYVPEEDRVGRDRDDRDERDERRDKPSAREVRRSPPRNPPEEQPVKPVKPAPDTTSDPKLVRYGMRSATCTCKVLLVLAEKHKDARFVAIDLHKGEQKHVLHKLRQPFGRIPVLDDHGFILYESRAIIRYLDEKFSSSGPRLTPSTLEGRARMNQWISVEYSYLAPAATLIFQELLWKPAGSPVSKKAIAAGRAGVAQVLDVVDRVLKRQPYLAGSSFSLADVCWMPALENLFLANQGDLVEERPGVLGWWKRVSTRPSWKAVRKAGAYG